MSDYDITVTNDDALRLFCVNEKVKVLIKLSSECRFCENKLKKGNIYCELCLKEWLDKPYAI